MRVFFSDDDRQAYLDLVSEQFEAHDVEVRAWCLMTNHIHLIAVPETKDSLAAAIGQVHQRYTRMINFRQKKRGYLFQGRFHSCVMDGRALLSGCSCVCRLEPGPGEDVRTGLGLPMVERTFSCQAAEV